MSRRVTAFIAAALVGLGMLAPAAMARTGSSSFPARHRSAPAPMIRVGSTLPGLRPLAWRMASQSANWAGYDATGGGFRSVSATWTQPAATPDATTASYSAFWVGLDGDGSDSVEQCGTDADNDHGTLSYYAWYEMFPADSVAVSMTITPGDVMHCSVVSDGTGGFTLTLSDQTTGVTKTFKKQSTIAPAKLDRSAEVIAEAPSDGSSGAVLPLADFGSVSFSSCAINGAPLASAAWQQIDMVDPSTNTALATTSALGADGASFSVTSGAPSSPASPTLSSFSPATGPAGTLVTLSGTGLDGASAVTFAGTAAQFTVTGDTQITATVPAGAASGPISVTTAGGTATSATAYTVTPSVTPLQAKLALSLGGLRGGVLRLGARITMNAHLTPTSLAGGRVTFTLERRRAGHWHSALVRTRATGADGRSSTASRLGHRGTYRVRATIAPTATNTAAASRWLQFQVK